MTEFSDLDGLSVNTLRALSIDQPQAANSGHPGLPLGAAPMAYLLWQRHLRFDPTDPDWPDRDRFVLSAGHGSALLYSLLHLYGYDLPIEELKNFRQWDSRTPGHPERHMTAGVEATTGPLGQGLANVVGMAIAERWLAARFNQPGHTIVDHRTYALVSDGDVMEGVAQEASAVAGFLGLGKLILLFDSNHVTLDGPLDMSTREDTALRYESCGWQVLRVEDGDVDLGAIDRAIERARADTDHPSLIIIDTTIGYGSPNKAGSHRAHGEPLGEEEARLTKQALGWSWADRTFHVPEEVREHATEARERGGRARSHWQTRFDAWAEAHPDRAEEWRLAWSGRLPDGWDSDLPSWERGDLVATRVAAGKTLNAIASRVPWLIGGDADLSGSTKTTIEGSPNFDGRTGEGRNLRYGIREHAMGAISNGLAYHGGVRPYAATFLVFSDYMRPTVRLAAMNDLPVVYVWTHDSIGVGEDGPTHQPVEHLMSLRAIPNLTIIRPADAAEAKAAWVWTMTHTKGPVALVLSRQKLPTIDSDGDPSGVHRGGYVAAEAVGGAPEAIIIATGSEVSIAIEASRTLSGEGIPVRVVSLPSWEIFQAQGPEYRDTVLPPSITARVSVEAGVTLGWERWIGDRGVALGVDRFGASAPGPVNMAKYGLDPETIADEVRGLVRRPGAG